MSAYKTLPRYKEHIDATEYLQLHDNRTLWKIDNPNLTDEFYIQLVNDAIQAFEDSTEVKLYLLGRSGRHVCIEDTPSNSRQFHWLCKLALKLEKQVIKAANLYQPLVEDNEILPADQPTDQTCQQAQKMV